MISGEHKKRVWAAICALHKHIPVAEVIQNIVNLTFTKEELTYVGFLSLNTPPYPDYAWNAAILQDNLELLGKMREADPVEPRLLWFLLAIRNRCFNSLEFINGITNDFKKRRKWIFVDYAFEENDEHAIQMADTLNGYGFNTSTQAYRKAIKSKNINALKWLFNKSAILREFIVAPADIFDVALFSGDVEIIQWVNMTYQPRELKEATIMEVIKRKDHPVIEWMKTNRLEEMCTIKILTKAAIPSGDVSIVVFIMENLSYDENDYTRLDDSDDEYYSTDYIKRNTITLDKIRNIIECALEGKLEIFKLVHRKIADKFKSTNIANYCGSCFRYVNRKTELDILEFYKYIFEANLDKITLDLIIEIIDPELKSTYGVPYRESISQEIIEWFLLRLPYPDSKAKYEKLNEFHAKLPRAKNMHPLTREILNVNLQKHIDYWEEQEFDTDEQ